MARRIRPSSKGAAILRLAFLSLFLSFALPHGLALAQGPGEIGAQRIAATANALAGRIDEARSIIAGLVEVHPRMRLSGLGKILGLSRKEDVDRMLRGLRLAGMPE